MAYNFSKEQYLKLVSGGLSDAEIVSSHPFADSTFRRWKTNWGLRGYNRKHGSGKPKMGKELPCPVCQRLVYHTLTALKNKERKACSRKCSAKNPSFISKLKAADKSYMQTDEYRKSLHKPHKTELERYRRDVYSFTKRSYRDKIDLINPNRYPRGRCGVAGAYQLDHVISIKEGFVRGLSAEYIGSAENLQMLPWKQNLLKSSGA